MVQSLNVPVCTGTTKQVRSLPTRTVRERRLLVPPDKANYLLTILLLINCLEVLSLSRKFEPSIPLTLVGWLYLLAHFRCYDMQVLGRSPIKWRPHSDMIIAADWGVQSNKQVKEKKN